MTLSGIVRRLSRSPLLLFILGALCLGASEPLITLHLQTLREVQTDVLPRVARIPELEQRLAILKEQAELSELDALLRTGSQSENVRVFVLPTEPDLDRLLAAFNVLHADLVGRSLAGSLSEIQIGEATVVDDLRAQPVTLDLAVRGRGADIVFRWLRLAGFVTVGDALTKEEMHYLVRTAEEENPAGVVALEQFFATDLFAYAREPRPFQEQLKRSLVGPAFLRALQSTEETSLLRDARELFQSGLGDAFDRSRLWPMQFITVRDAELKPGKAEDWYTLNLTLQLYSRQPSAA
ncbi:MAG: hypothetical protein PHI23_02410 [Candidatus Peribacteraceae bacterium]|nr:hypothetical protein [Candidatus Peribacteraceae bacterium]